MVTVSISETYDLQTKSNKMSIVGIHTPSMSQVLKTYPGLLMNYRFMRLKKCDVKMACASVLPADPLQVGVSAGDIAPQDMFNPILYRAITNEGADTMLARINGLRGVPSAAAIPISGGSADVEDSHVTGLSDDFNVYYSLLSHRDGWKIAHPQQGLSLRGLVPLVFERLYNVANNPGWTDGSNKQKQFETVEYADSNGAIQLGDKQVYSMRGKARPLPKIECTHVAGFTAETAVQRGGWMGTEFKLRQSAGEVMNDLNGAIYVAMFVLPPAKLHTFFYRLVCRWELEFFDVRPIQDIQGFDGLNTMGSSFYGTNYTFSSKDISKEMEHSLSMVDTSDADIEKIMEGA